MPDVSSQESTPSSTPVVSPTMPGDTTTRTMAPGPRARASAQGRAVTDSPALSAAASRKHLERVQRTLYRETQPASGGSPVWRPRSASVSWDKEGPSLPANYHKTGEVEIAVNTPPQTKDRSSLLGFSADSPSPDVSLKLPNNNSDTNNTSASTNNTESSSSSAAGKEPVAERINSAPSPTPLVKNEKAAAVSAASTATTPAPTAEPAVVPPLNLAPAGVRPMPAMPAMPPHVMPTGSPPPENMQPYPPAPMYYPVPPHLQVDFQQFFESLSPQQQAQYMQQQAMYMASVNSAYAPPNEQREDGAPGINAAMQSMSLDNRGYPAPSSAYGMPPQAYPHPHGMWQQPPGMYASPPQSPMSPHHPPGMYGPPRNTSNGAHHHANGARGGRGPRINHKPNGPNHNGNNHHNNSAANNGHNAAGNATGASASATTGTNSMVPTDVAPPHVTVDNMVCWEVRFKAGRTDVYCTTNDAPGELGRMDYVMVEADRGKDMGVLVEPVPCDNYVNDPDILKRRILRRAHPAEVSQVATKATEEQNALEACRAKVVEHKLPMEIAEAEYQFDRRKLTFYFNAEGRIDFRILVRDLFKLFKTRIWLKQLPTPESANTAAAAAAGATPSASSAPAASETTPASSTNESASEKSATPPPVAH